MSVMIIGADHLGSITKNMEQYGIHEILHVTGRSSSDLKKFSIPLSTRLVIVLIDYINHITARNIKEQAKAKGVPLLFAKRSWCSIQGKLVECGYQCKMKNDACIGAKSAGHCPASMLSQKSS